MKELTFKVNVPDGWKPLKSACWDGCPFACLTKLGDKCIAREAYIKDGLMICPVVRFSGELQWSRKGMTFKEAARLINPNTCTEALEEYKRFGEECAVKAMERACDLACKALEFIDDYGNE